jgi:hypothetical protein
MPDKQVSPHTDFTLTISTSDLDVLARIAAALKVVAAMQDTPATAEVTPDIGAVIPGKARPDTSYRLPDEQAETVTVLDKDEIIRRLMAGDRSPELLAAIDDPDVSVPEQVAAQKTYPFAEGDLA